jgi:hypothetical protein
MHLRFGGVILGVLIIRWILFVIFQTLNFGQGTSQEKGTLSEIEATINKQHEFQQSSKISFIDPISNV